MHVLDKIVPQDPGWVLEYTNEYRNLGRLVFNCWSSISLLNIEEFSKLAEACETPIALLSNETMVGVWS